MKVYRVVLNSILWLGCLLFCCRLEAQNKSTDSLFSLLSSHTTQDSIRVNLLNEIASSYLTKDLSLADYFTNNAITLSKQINYTPGLTKALIIKASILQQRGFYDKALTNYLNALNKAESIQDTPDISDIYNSLGDIYLYTNDITSAQNSYKASLKLQQQIRDTSMIISLLGKIGNIQLQFINAKNVEDRNYTDVFNIFNQEFMLSSQQNNQEGIADALDNMGNIYFQQGQYDKATYNFSAALDLFQKLNNPQRIANLYFEIGALALSQNKYPVADTSLQLAYNMAQQQQNNHLKMNVALKLAIAKALNNNPNAAIHYQQIYQQLRDSIDNSQQSKNVADLQVRYKTQKKENTINQLQQQQVKQNDIIRQQVYWQIAICFIVVLLAIVAILLYRTNKISKRHNEELAQKNENILHTKEEMEIKNKELEKLNKIKDRILSVISHDIRNPLASMEMMLELMKTGGLTIQEIAMVTDSLSESLTETNNFLNNILEWSKNQMSGIHAKPTLLNVKDSVIENVRFCKWQAERKNIQLISDVPDKLRAFADREMLRIVLRNITTNAIKFTKENGHIQIGAEKLNGHVKMWIKDDGVGIKPADRPKVFGVDNFSSKGTANEIGTGLGLVLCKEMIESNGGSIWFESEENKGTTFFFTLPGQQKTSVQETADVTA
jgi:two-component system, sensor histidine kinase and response regulator